MTDRTVYAAGAATFWAAAAVTLVVGRHDPQIATAAPLAIVLAIICTVGWIATRKDRPAMADNDEDQQDQNGPKHPQDIDRGEGDGTKTPRTEWDKQRNKPGTRKGNWPKGGGK